MTIETADDARKLALENQSQFVREVLPLIHQAAQMGKFKVAVAEYQCGPEALRELNERGFRAERIEGFGGGAWYEISW